MIQTNHIWTENPIYCHKLRKVLVADINHLRNECGANCPFYTGSAQGQGVENVYYDGSNEPLMQNPDPDMLLLTMRSISDELVQQAADEWMAKVQVLEAAKLKG